MGRRPCNGCSGAYTLSTGQRTLKKVFPNLVILRPWRGERGLQTDPSKCVHVWRAVCFRGLENLTNQIAK